MRITVQCVGCACEKTLSGRSLTALNSMCSHSCSGPGWQNRGCQLNGSNIHLHSYEVMWVKCLHQGRKDRDSDAAGFKPPTLWSRSWAYRHTLTLYVHLIRHRFRKSSSGEFVLGDFLAFLAPLSFQLIDLCDCFAARASLRWKLQDIERSHDRKTFGFPLIFWESERESWVLCCPQRFLLVKQSLNHWLVLCQTQQST